MISVRNEEKVRFRKNPAFCFGIHLFLLILFLAFLVGIESELISERRELLFVIAIMMLVAIIISIIYSCFFDWNSWVYIDGEKNRNKDKREKLSMEME